jgi:hypothetical protein
LLATVVDRNVDNFAVGLHRPAVWKEFAVLLQHLLSEWEHRIHQNFTFIFRVLHVWAY